LDLGFVEEAPLASLRDRDFINIEYMQLHGAPFLVKKRGAGRPPNLITRSTFRIFVFVRLERLLLEGADLSTDFLNVPFEIRVIEIVVRVVNYLDGLSCLAEHTGKAREGLIAHGFATAVM
jgi:hypothetical protein